MISSPLIFLLPQSNEVPPQKIVTSMRPILLQGLLFTKQKTSASSHFLWRHHFAVVEYIKLTGKKFDDVSPILFYLPYLACCS